MIRAFCAIRPPEAACDRLEDLALRLDEGRAVPWENLHLTLGFLGEAPAPEMEDVALELERVAAEAPEVAIEGVGVFGGRVPRSAHARVRPDARLSRLAAQVRRAARRGGRELPRERFVPHVTVARFTGRAPAGARLARWLEREKGFACAPFRAARFGLWRSELTASGPIYTEVMAVPLE